MPQRVDEGEYHGYDCATGGVCHGLPSSCDGPDGGGANIVADLGNVSDATFGEVGKHLDERQITDLTLLCCYFVVLGATINAFGIGLEPDRKPLMKPVK